LRKKEFQTTRERVNSTIQDKRIDLLTVNKIDIELFGFFGFIGERLNKWFFSPNIMDFFKIKISESILS
jgi:hypothetical protein